MNIKFSRLVFIAVTMVGSCLLLAGCLSGGKSDSGAGAELQTLSPTALASVKVFVGSAKCQACHPGEYSQWEKTWHAKVVQPYTPPPGRTSPKAPPPPSNTRKPPALAVPTTHTWR